MHHNILNFADVEKVYQANKSVYSTTKNIKGKTTVRMHTVGTEKQRQGNPNRKRKCKPQAEAKFSRNEELISKSA